MPNLQVRNVPPRLREKVRRLAKADNCSLSAEVVELLDQAVSQRQTRDRVAGLLADIKRNRFTPRPDTPTSTELVREDRAR
jgi:plasmid stability protein